MQLRKQHTEPDISPAKRAATPTTLRSNGDSTRWLIAHVQPWERTFNPQRKTVIDAFCSASRSSPMQTLQLWNFAYDLRISEEDDCERVTLNYFRCSMSSALLALVSSSKAFLIPGQLWRAER
mmetsp:Transcript_14759/g.29921  ORF Transcript_14759/g.29921 Transcript_14759/m.29921 type:complete len:123 (+) Transcript_14759:483-851(+)